MPISEEYLVRSLIEIKENIAKLELSVKDGLDKCSLRLDENNNHLAEHMKRTALLEIQIQEFNTFMIRTKFLSKIVMILSGAFVTVIGLILSFLHFIR